MENENPCIKRGQKDWTLTWAGIRRKRERADDSFNRSFI